MRAVLLAAALSLVPVAWAQKKAQPAPLEISGIVADAKGPLANKVVRAGPLDAQGNMLRMRSLSGSTAGQSLNPQATSDAQGRFTLKVDRAMLKGYREDRLGLMVYTDLGGGRMSSSHDAATVAFDAGKDKIDAGRLVFPPLKAR